MSDIVKKWAGCMASVVWGFGGEDGHALREDGYNENYGCEEPKIVKGGNYPVVDVDGEVAKLHGTGKFNDPEVMAALEKSCGNCRYYKARMR